MRQIKVAVISRTHIKTPTKAGPFPGQLVIFEVGLINQEVTSVGLVPVMLNIVGHPICTAMAGGEQHTHVIAITNP